MGTTNLNTARTGLACSLIRSDLKYSAPRPEQATPPAHSRQHRAEPSPWSRKGQNGDAAHGVSGQQGGVAALLQIRTEDRFLRRTRARLPLPAETATAGNIHQILCVS
jgi:hypothetical protein